MVTTRVFFSHLDVYDVYKSTFHTRFAVRKKGAPALTFLIPMCNFASLNMSSIYSMVRKQ